MHDKEFFKGRDMPDIDISINFGQMTLTERDSNATSSGRAFRIIPSPYSDDDEYWNNHGGSTTENNQVAAYRRITENHLDSDIVQWASNGGLLPAPPIHDSWVGEFSIVRVQLLNDRVGLELDQLLLHHVFIPSLIRLNDGSWEVMVRTKNMDHVHHLIKSVHTSFMIQEEYNPIDPLARDLELFGRSRAEALAVVWFQERVSVAQNSPHQIPQDYYTYLYMEKREEMLRRLSMGSVVYVAADGRRIMALL
ncbi:hypothetical protein PV05_03203 [Exophiala xenobiotica]|uniref:Uncharacterized protein n=1 Tax=Exophiala xenobiotica TaxID=348802 RepID=A0A0D2FF06_9EURO|nr:uncharacterized protein PV05_03203 [Exophiala xenobiotica]KIW58704.1 hypothetical protein PV05_03203 [Exophiala xenobiotica]